MTDARRDLLLWIVDLAPPLIWLLCFEANFALAPWACVFQAKIALYAVSLVALLLETVNASVAWSQWKATGRAWPDDAPGPLPRARIMALCGVAFSGAFSMIIVAQMIPSLVLGACE